MSREYLHSLRTGCGFRRPELVAARLKKAGYTVHRATTDVVQFIGPGAEDIGAQARWAAEQAVHVENEVIEVSVQPTWSGDAYRGVLFVEGKWRVKEPEEL